MFALIETQHTAESSILRTKDVSTRVEDLQLYALIAVVAVTVRVRLLGVPPLYFAQYRQNSSLETGVR